MNYSEYRETLRKDRCRYGSNISHAKLYCINGGYKIVTNYRRCKLLEGKRFLFGLYCLQRYLYNRKCVKSGCDIPSHISVGAGFRIDHPIGIVINSKAVIGENFTIKSGSVIGRNDRGIPTIGNNVSLGVHAILLGDITVGDGATVGAGAIVTHDVPPGGIVIGKAAEVHRIIDK